MTTLLQLGVSHAHDVASLTVGIKNDADCERPAIPCRRFWCNPSMLYLVSIIVIPLKL